MNCSRRFIECDVTHRTNILERLPPRVPPKKTFYNLPLPPWSDDNKNCTATTTSAA